MPTDFSIHNQTSLGENSKTLGLDSKKNNFQSERYQRQQNMVQFELLQRQ